MTQEGTPAVTDSAVTEKAAPSVLSTEQMDRLNLEQALVDFEIANARVVDLTGRVTTMTSELLRLRSELGRANLRVNQAEADSAAAARHVEEIRRSIAFRVARALGDLLARARRR